MTTEHLATIRRAPRQRCLRHHVWMAACDDCRTARTEQAGIHQSTAPKASGPAR